tara:strand:+ start:58 stop:480 length:423 start_codon:yes stop_codon:yes gene_type:complete
MKDKVYLRIYQTESGSSFSYHDLFTTGKLSQMIGHGDKHFKLKDGSLVVIVAKSYDPKDTQSIDLALVKVKNQSEFNPWKGYGDFYCYDVDFIHTRTVDYLSDYKGSSDRIFDIARSIGTGHQNSAKTRELALFMFMDCA